MGGGREGREGGLQSFFKTEKVITRFSDFDPFFLYNSICGLNSLVTCKLSYILTYL